MQRLTTRRTTRYRRATEVLTAKIPASQVDYILLSSEFASCTLLKSFVHSQNPRTHLLVATKFSMFQRNMSAEEKRVAHGPPAH